jgi:hypothetical protein
MTVPAPNVCPTCDGTGLQLVNIEHLKRGALALCLDCRCVICGRHTAAIGGECGECHDEADRYFARVGDR